MSKKSSVILLANDINGLEVANYLAKRGDTIVRLYIHSPKFQKYTPQIIKAAKVEKKNIYYDKDLKNPVHIKELQKIKYDYLLSVHWKWLLSAEVLQTPRKGNVNFHPAYLPIGRGWYPHVFSFINGTPTGVTIHQMDVGMDSGPIWAQKKVPIRTYDTSKDIYIRLQKELLSLFLATWPKIVEGKIRHKKQNEKYAISYSMDQVRKLDEIDMDKKMKVRDVINLLRARSFGDLGFAHYEDKKKKVYLNLRLSETPSFEK